MIVNPGSVGLPAYRGDFPYQHKMETGYTHARYSIICQIQDDWLIENYAIPYDWKNASIEAKKNGRLDWELYLSTGRA